MKKSIFFLSLFVMGSLAMYSCKSSYDGGCAAFGGSHKVTKIKPGTTVL